MIRGIDLSVFLKMAGDLVKPLKDAEDKVTKSTGRMKKKLTLEMKLAAGGLAATGLKIATNRVINDFTQSYREVQRASGDLRSLGVQDMEAIISEGQRLQGTYVGLTTDAFVRAAYDIRSGVSSLSDEGVAAMTASALTAAKATKGMPESMTSLFATSYGIFKKQFSEMSDADWGDMFGAALSKSVQQFKTDGAKMQQAIESAGAGATNLGVSMTEQMTLLGMMQQQMQAGEAGTALRAFATNAARAHEKFGAMKVTTDRPVRVRILDENGQLRAMPDILTDLKDRYGETLDAFEAAEIKEAFGTDEAMKMINALYGQEEAVRANAAALADAANQGKAFTESMAENVDNYDGAEWEKFIQQIDVLKQKIGAGLLPAMDNMTPVLGSIVTGFSNFASEHPGVVAGLASVLVGISGITAVAAPMLFAMASMTKSFGTLKTGIKGMSALLAANPILLAVAAIAGGAYLIYQNWEPIKAFFSDLWDGVKSFTSSAWEGIKSVFLNYTPAGLIYQHWDQIGAYFSGKWDEVKATFATKWEAIKAGTVGWAADFLGIGRNILAGLSDGITAGVQRVIDTVSGIGSSIVSTFKSVLGIASPSKVFAGFGGFLMEGLIGGIKAKIADVKDAINGIGSNVVGWFRNKLGINSPSRVFAGLGGHLSEGLAVGIDRQSGQVFASMERIRQGVALPVAATAAIGAASLGGGAIAAPSLGPASFDPVAAPASAPSTGRGITIHFAPTYHIGLSGEFTSDQEESLRLMLEEHDRQQQQEIGRLLND